MTNRENEKLKGLPRDSNLTPFNKLQMKGLGTSPLSAFDKFEKNDETLTVKTQNSDKAQTNVNKMLTAPLYALSRPIQKFRLSSCNNEKKVIDEAQKRLFERSKIIHHKLKKDGLFFLTDMMKELNQNYDMFEKKYSNIEAVNMKPSEINKTAGNMTETLSTM